MPLDVRFRNFLQSYFVFWEYYFNASHRSNVSMYNRSERVINEAFVLLLASLYYKSGFVSFSRSS